MYIFNLTDIGPVSITTDPKKFQQDLQELFVQVRTQIAWINHSVRMNTLDYGEQYVDCQPLKL